MKFQKLEYGFVCMDFYLGHSENEQLNNSIWNKGVIINIMLTINEIRT